MFMPLYLSIYKDVYNILFTCSFEWYENSSLTKNGPYWTLSLIGLGSLVGGSGLPSFL